jgi:predicted RNA polymerase sigma factor
MRRHHRLYAVRGHLLDLNGDGDAAREQYRIAARLTASRPEQRYLNRKLAISRPPPAG